MYDSTVLCLTVGRVNYDCDINFYEPLTRLFSRVARYNYLERMEHIGRDAMNRELLEFARAEKPRYVFFITYQDQIRLETLQSLREIGCMVVAWFSDDHWRFDDYSRLIASHIHCSITTDAVACEKYRRFRLPVVLTQWAANPDYYRNLQLAQTIDVSFVGQNYGTRGQILHYFKAGGVPLEIFGRGFGTFLEFDDIIRIFNQSRININLSGSSKDPSIRQIKGRIFEVPMCGGFLFTEEVPGLEEYFEIGKEMVVFSDELDGIEKLRYYLSHEEERSRIALAGYRRAQNDHRWELRLKSVFDTIEKEYGSADTGIHSPGIPQTDTTVSGSAPASVESLCTPGDLVFDIGANIGAKADAYVKRGIRVVCFEPQPACVQALRQRFSASALVTIVDKGVAARPGTLELSICNASPTISTFSDEWKKGRFSRYSWDQKITVDVTTLDEAIDRYGTPTYCKIDVEGFELDVLRGLNRTAGVLSFEFTREFIDAARQCVDRCVAVGYREFNFVVGEGQSFFLQKWTGPAMLFSHIDRIADDLLWGDIYAK